MKRQGRCQTTQTERFENPLCRCPTYAGNLGPCSAFKAGANGRCVYCDHTTACHCVCEALESGTREIPIGQVATCPAHPSKTFTRGPSGMWA